MPEIVAYTRGFGRCRYDIGNIRNICERDGCSDN